MVSDVCEPRLESALNQSVGDDTAPSALEFILLALSLLVPLVVLVGYVLNLARLDMGARAIGVPVGIIVCFVHLVAWRRGIRPRLETPQFAGGALAFVVVAGYSLWLAWPHLFPISASVDAVHHYQLIDYIYEHRGLVHDPAAGLNLGEMTVYPFGATLVTAFLAWATGAPPIALMHPVVSACLGFTALLVYALSSELLRGDALRVPASLVAALLLFVPYEYSVGQFVANYYLTQMFGQVWLLALLFWLVRLDATRRRFYLVPMLGAGSALALSYPTWLPSFTLTLAAMLWLRRDDAIRRRLTDGVLFLVPIGILLVLFLKDRWQGGLGIIRHEGATELPSIHGVGVLFAVLTLAGLALSLRHRRFAAPLVLLSIYVAQMALTYALACLHITSYYSAHKMWYQLVLLAAPFAGLTLARAPHILGGAGFAERRKPLLAIALLAVLIPSLDKAVSNGRPRVPPLGPELYEAAVWARDHLSEQKLAHVTGSHLAPYWIQIGILKGPRSRSETSRLLSTPVGYVDWYWDHQQPDYAIVDEIDDDMLLGGKVVFRSGSAAVVKREVGRSDQATRTTSEVVSGVPIWAGSDLLILGYELPSSRYEAGESIPLMVLVKTARTLWRHYLIAGHLYDAEGRLWSQADAMIAEDPGRLHAGSRLRLALILRLPADTPPGVYHVEVFVLSLPSYARLAMRDAGSREERRLLVGPLLVPSRHDLPNPDEVAPVGRLYVRLGSGLLLRGYDPPSSGARPGEAVRVTLYWEALSVPHEDYTAFVHLIDAQGRLVAQRDSYPLDGRHPTSLWQPGEVVRDRVELRLPVDLPPGDYRLLTGMYLLRTMERLPVLDAGDRHIGDSVELGAVTVER